MITRIGRRLVIENDRCQEIPTVAVVAGALGQEMIDALASRRRTVVAARACACGDVGVIEVRREPSVGRVADVALRGRL